jgi:hypothetical protein
MIAGRSAGSLAPAVRIVISKISFRGECWGEGRALAWAPLRYKVNGLILNERKCPVPRATNRPLRVNQGLGGRIGMIHMMRRIFRPANPIALAHFNVDACSSTTSPRSKNSTIAANPLHDLR